MLAVLLPLFRISACADLKALRLAALPINLAVRFTAGAKVLPALDLKMRCGPCGARKRRRRCENSLTEDAIGGANAHSARAALQRPTTWSGAAVHPVHRLETGHE